MVLQVRRSRPAGGTYFNKMNWIAGFGIPHPTAWGVCMGRYLIGIDLGTTNSALAYLDLQTAKTATPKIEHFAIPQLVRQAETAPRELLPSFLYLPGAHDLPPGATALPWDAACPYAVGEFARNHGRACRGDS